MADKLDDENFLQRWSARKLEARDGGDGDGAKTSDGPVTEQLVSSDPDGDPDGDPSGDPSVNPSAEASGVSDQPPPDLPNVETLDADSDYTAFLGDNVPADVTKLALRKLWRSDPVLANVDGLNDYDEDFSMVGTVSEVVKTAYRIGKGYLTDEEIEEARAADDGDGDGEGVEVKSEPMAAEASDDASEDVSAIAADNPDEVENEAVEFHDAELPKPV